MANALILLASGFEELEAVSIIDILRRAGIIVTVSGLEPGPVTASRGTVIVPDKALQEILGDDFDMIILPGGQPGTNNLDADPRVHELLKKMNDSKKMIAAICAAPRVLANSGLLEGRCVSCFPGALEDIKLNNTSISTDPVFIDDNIVTSRGPGTAMDFALTLVDLLCDEKKCLEVEKSLAR